MLKNLNVITKRIYSSKQTRTTFQIKNNVDWSLYRKEPTFEKKRETTLERPKRKNEYELVKDENR